MNSVCCICSSFPWNTRPSTFLSSFFCVSTCRLTLRIYPPPLIGLLCLWSARRCCRKTRKLFVPLIVDVQRELRRILSTVLGLVSLRPCWHWGGPLEAARLESREGKCDSCWVLALGAPFLGRRWENWVPGRVYLSEVRQLADPRHGQYRGEKQSTCGAEADLRSHP